jgi:hypothetical protein
METQNVTLSLPKAILNEARHLAVERGTSVSKLLAEYIERLVRDDENYRKAMRRARRRLASGFDLGTRGTIAVGREALHER